jgi:phenylacetate-coenzyme A ligase PaaK-like adenylate-forming protein
MDARRPVGALWDRFRSGGLLSDLWSFDGAGMKPWPFIIVKPRTARHKPLRAHQYTHQGWMGRADQTAKVKGMFVRPEQIAEIGKRHPELGRLRLVVTRSGEADLMTLKVETASPGDTLQSELSATLRAVTKLGGNVELVAASSLPNDGKVISDER